MKVKVENMRSKPGGNRVPNQYKIVAITDNGVVTFFQSYNSVIVEVRTDPVSARNIDYLDREKWDYSKTTGKYRNLFLGEKKTRTQKMIDIGEYILTDLN